MSCNAELNNAANGSSDCQFGYPIVRRQSSICLRGRRFQWALLVNYTGHQITTIYTLTPTCYTAALANDFVTTCYVQVFVKFATIFMAPCKLSLPS